MRKRDGFTLIELLVVVGMIVALAGLLLPALHRAYLVAEKSRIASDLQVIGNALEAYRGDFGSYPQPGGKLSATLAGQQPTRITGQKILCWALVAPGPVAQDGADGPGFRLRGATGRVYGPYLPADRFVVGTYGGNPGDTAGVISCAATATPPNDLADRRGRVILYYAAHSGAHPSSQAGSYVGTPQSGAPVQSMWDPSDDYEVDVSFANGPRTLLLMADYGLRNLLGAARDGSLPPGSVAVAAPYLLISAGTEDPIAQTGVPDSFGMADNVANVPLSPRFPIPDPMKN